MKSVFTSIKTITFPLKVNSTIYLRPFNISDAEQLYSVVD